MLKKMGNIFLRQNKRGKKEKKSENLKGEKKKDIEKKCVIKKNG